MASMRDIKARIIATKKTAQITNAMYMVSASKLKKAERAMISYRPMVKRLNHIIQGLLTDDEVSHVLLEKRPVKKTCYILISSDRGLAGPYNANLFRKFQSHIKEMNIDPSTVLIAAIGQKAFSFAKRNQYQLVNDKPIHVRDDIQFIDFKEITQKFISLFLSKNVDEIVVFYSHFINTLYQNVESKTILPVRLEETDEPHKIRYEYEPNKTDIINQLLPMVVENTLYGFILEAKAGEHASRMTAMKSATDNAKDVIKKLELHYNRARQAAITIELTDIIGGANAVK
jgi:F-type H+-transporting ATPase subunit gamma